ncbi:MAG: DUF1697 domain-containing protein [Candidatus Krumholzibacteriia bacterium]
MQPAAHEKSNGRKRGASRRGAAGQRRRGAVFAAIEAAIAARCGFTARVVVVTAAELAAIVRENPLPGVATNPSRLLVAFVARPAALDAARPLLREAWAPDALAVGSRAAYLWCADGVLGSPLSQAFGRDGQESDEGSGLSRYELTKANALCRGAFNLGACVWRHGARGALRLQA